MTGLIIEVFRLNGDLLAAGDFLVGDIGLTSARWQVLGSIALSPVPLQWLTLPAICASLGRPCSGPWMRCVKTA
jgi:hypothetical protein